MSDFISRLSSKSQQAPRDNKLESFIADKEDALCNLKKSEEHVSGQAGQIYKICAPGFKLKAFSYTSKLMDTWPLYWWLENQSNYFPLVSGNYTGSLNYLLFSKEDESIKAGNDREYLCHMVKRMEGLTPGIIWCWQEDGLSGGKMAKNGLIMFLIRTKEGFSVWKVLCKCFM